MSLTSKDYKLAGEIMAMSVMQGGQAPNLTSSKIFDYLRGKLSVSQIESSTTRELCEKEQVGKILPQLLQLEEGLQTYGLLASIHTNPTVWETVFVIGKGNSVTASSLIDPFDVKHSENQVK
ncbi:Hypothetical predicted protein [Paramuricea clavata]|uniref:Uncharacterized protein n=1 Tax=Paramuricea clavata TaxID=317549 RepID=A0A7D9D772_PARCT|nr:Hypothetical predicted protein [Paramuricea clavata]